MRPLLGGESCDRGGAPFHLLQLRTGSEDVADYARNGRWHFRPRLELRGNRGSGGGGNGNTSAIAMYPQRIANVR